MMLSTLALKIIALVTMLVATFLFSMIPLKLMNLVKRRDCNDNHRVLSRSILSLLSCYAAGVFLATCLLDLFPEVRNKMEDVFDHRNILSSFPLSEFIVIFGFFIILFVEQCVLMCKEHATGYSRVPTSDLCQGPGHAETQNPVRHFSPNLLDEDLSGLLSSEDEDHSFRDTPDGEKTEMYQDPSSNSTIRSVMLLLALSLHSVFEGLALGLQPKASDVLQIFAAVSLHKAILAFSLGMKLVQSKMSLSAMVKSNLLFSVTAPIGIGIGIAITDVSPNSLASETTDCILQGIACGTFLYVVFFEILPHEFMSKRPYPARMLKTLFLILGYATVSGLLFLNPNKLKPLCPNGG